MKLEQTHYYLIGGEIKKGEIMPNDIQTDKIELSYDMKLRQWKQSLQPCSITDVELEKIKSNVFGTVFNTDTIEVTDIVTDNDGVVVFREPKSEANEADLIKYLDDCINACNIKIKEFGDAQMSYSVCSSEAMKQAYLNVKNEIFKTKKSN